MVLIASSEQRNGKDVGERLTEVLLDEIVRVKQVTVGSSFTTAMVRARVAPELGEPIFSSNTHRRDRS
jgi:hypothetical protein